MEQKLTTVTDLEAAKQQLEEKVTDLESEKQELREELDKAIENLDEMAYEAMEFEKKTWYQTRKTWFDIEEDECLIRCFLIEAWLVVIRPGYFLDSLISTTFINNGLSKVLNLFGNIFSQQFGLFCKFSCVVLRVFE